MIAMLTDINRQHTSELRAGAVRRGVARRATGRTARRGQSTEGPAVTIRRLDRVDGDRPALVRLAGRDSAEIPSGDLLGAETGGVLVAAISLRTGETIADPFTPTAAIRATLETRAAQITGSAVKQSGASLSRRPAHESDSTLRPTP